VKEEKSKQDRGRKAKSENTKKIYCKEINSREEKKKSQRDKK